MPITCCRGDFAFFFLAGDRLLEEEVCDRFAAEILLPTALAEQLLSVPVPTADDFAALYENSHASRAVCARRVADALPRLGHAVVALGTAVTYCASAHTLFRAGYMIEQGDHSIFAEAVRHGGAAGMARLLYQENVVSPLFQAEAVFREGRRSIVAMATPRVPQAPQGSTELCSALRCSMSCR